MNQAHRTVEQLRDALKEIESKLVWGDLPLMALEEFKVALDGTRTTLLALLDADGPADYQASLRRFRLRRAAQICENVLQGMRTGAIDRETPGLAAYAATARESLGPLDEVLGGNP